MKIAYCLWNYSAAGGLERIAHAKATWLAAHGYDVTFIVYHQCGKDPIYPLGSIKFVDLNIKEMPPMATFYRSPAFKEMKRKLKAHLLENHYDIVISTAWFDRYFINWIHDGSKKIMEMHVPLREMEIQRKEQRWPIRLNAKLLTWKTLLKGRSFDRVVLLTDRDIPAWRRVGARVVKIPNMANLVPERISTCDAHEVIAVGRLSPQKGFDYLLDAWAIVVNRHPDWHLSIYGDCNDKTINDLHAQIDRNGLSRDILKGNCNDIMPRYAASSIMVCSSRYEGFPLILLEAATCGLPIVSFDCPNGPSDIIQNGVNGILVPQVGDIQGLADGICRLIEDPALRKQMGQAALVIPKRFSPENIMPQWDALFKEVMNEK